MSYVNAPEVVQTGDRVVLAPTEMNAAAQEFGRLAEEIAATGNRLSSSIQQGLGPTDVWSSPKNKPTFITTCDELFVAFNALIESLYQNKSGLETYITERQDA
jgi:hypothetical protein